MGKKCVKNLVLSIMFFLIVIAVSLIAGKAEVYAAPQGSTTISLKSASTTSFSINVSYSSGDTDYFDVFVSPAGENAFKLASSYNRFSYGSASVSYADYNAGTRLESGKSYDVVVVPYTGSSSSKVYGTESGALEVSTAPNGKPTISKTTGKSTTSIYVEWGAVTGANLYYIQYYNYSKGSSYSKVVESSSTNVTLKDLRKNTKYVIRVYAAHKGPMGSIATNDYGSSSVYATVLPTKPSKPVITNSYNKKNGEITLQTDAISNAEGYQYEVYDCVKKKSVKKFTGGKYDYSYFKCKNSVFKSQRIFKVRVRAYAVDSAGKKLYGEWSSWNYCNQALNGKVLSKANGKLSIQWDKVEGAGKYVVYISTKKDSGYKKVGTFTKNSAIIKKCGSKSISKKTKYYLKIIPQIKVSGKYVSCADVFYYYAY